MRSIFAINGCQLFKFAGKRAFRGGSISQCCFFLHMGGLPGWNIRVVVEEENASWV